MSYFIELCRRRRREKLAERSTEVLPIRYDNVGVAIRDAVMLAGARNLGVMSFRIIDGRGACIVERKDASSPKLELTRARGT